MSYRIGGRRIISVGGDDVTESNTQGCDFTVVEKDYEKTIWSQIIVDIQFTTTVVVAFPQAIDILPILAEVTIGKTTRFNPKSRLLNSVLEVKTGDRCVLRDKSNR